jgi:hypothetical protein
MAAERVCREVLEIRRRPQNWLPIDHSLVGGFGTYAAPHWSASRGEGDCPKFLSSAWLEFMFWRLYQGYHDAGPDIRIGIYFVVLGIEYPTANKELPIAKLRLSRS